MTEIIINMNYKEIESFVKYSIKYQIDLAQHIAELFNTNIYVFDNHDFFVCHNDTKTEVIDGVRTVFRNNRRAVLSKAARQAFGTNVELFLRFVENNNIIREDNIGIYVINPKAEKEDKK
jgi:hypothetical protein